MNSHRLGWGGGCTFHRLFSTTPWFPPSSAAQSNLPPLVRVSEINALKCRFQRPLANRFVRKCIGSWNVMLKVTSSHVYLLMRVEPALPVRPLSRFQFCWLTSGCFASDVAVQSRVHWQTCRRQCAAKSDASPRTPCSRAGLSDPCGVGSSQQGWGEGDFSNIW